MLMSLALESGTDDGVIVHLWIILRSIVPGTSFDIFIIFSSIFSFNKHICAYTNGSGGLSGDLDYLWVSVS